MRFNGFVQRHMVGLVVAAALVGVAVGGILYAVGITTINPAQAGPAPTSSGGIVQVPNHIAHRDDFPSDEATVADLAHDLPFTPHVPKAMPAGLKLRTAVAADVHPSPTLTLTYGLPGWDARSPKGYSGPVVQIEVRVASKYPHVANSVEVPAGVAGATVWEIVQGAPAGQMGFVLQTPTVEYDMAIRVGADNQPTRDQVLAMIVDLAKQG